MRKFKNGTVFFFLSNNETIFWKIKSNFEIKLLITGEKLHWKITPVFMSMQGKKYARICKKGMKISSCSGGYDKKKKKKD